MQPLLQPRRAGPAPVSLAKDAPGRANPAAATEAEEEAVAAAATAAARVSCVGWGGGGGGGGWAGKRPAGRGPGGAATALQEPFVAASRLPGAPGARKGPAVAGGPLRIGRLDPRALGLGCDRGAKRE